MAHHANRYTPGARNSPPTVRFRCPACRGSLTSIIRSISQQDGLIIRRRRCADCDHRWYTAQQPEFLVPQRLIGWNSGTPFLIETSSQ